MGQEIQSKTEPEENVLAAAEKPTVNCYVCGNPLSTEDEILKERAPSAKTSSTGATDPRLDIPESGSGGMGRRH